MIHTIFICSIECDKSCAGCDGDGPDMCLTCADGYTLKDDLCVGRYPLPLITMVMAFTLTTPLTSLVI